MSTKTWQYNLKCQNEQDKKEEFTYVFVLTYFRFVFMNILWFNIQKETELVSILKWDLQN